MKLNNSVVVQQTMNDLSSAHLDKNRHLEKITRGERIRKAADDAAALAVSENLDAQARSMKVAERNINDGIAILDVIHGGISEISTSVKRLYEITIQASSETLAQEQRDQLQAAATEETRTIMRTDRSTNFGQNPTVDDTYMYGFVRNVEVQAGTGATADDRITIDTFDAETFWMDNGSGNPGNEQIYYNLGNWPNIENVHVFDYSSAQQAQKAIGKAVKQLDFLNQQLAANGASRNQLSRALHNLQTQGNVITGARAKITSADFALESAGLVKTQIVEQSGTAMLAQANKMSQGALRLIS